MWRNRQCVWDIEYVIGFFFILISAQLLVWLFTKGLYLFCLCVPAVLHGHWLEGRWVCGWALWQHYNGICLLEDIHLISIWGMSVGMKRKQQRGSRNGEEKAKQNKWLKVHDISYNLYDCHILWACAALGLGGGTILLCLFFFSYCFICNSYIHPTLHIWTVFQLQSKLKAVFHSVAG